jgi:outer membrane protein assembly factor BamB
LAAGLNPTNEIETKLGLRHTSAQKVVATNVNSKLHPLGMILAVLAGLTGVSSMAASGDAPAWPTFHGPQRDNLARETGLLKEWPKEGPRRLWKFSGCGNGYSCVSIAQGLLFITGDFGDQEMVLALDLAGKLKWKIPHGKAWRGPQPGARTTPTYDDGLVYHLGPHGNLSAFEAESGKGVWTVDLRQTFGAPLNTWGYTENLLIDGDKLLCMPGGTLGRVVALDKKTGRVLWANTEIADRAAYSSPIVAVHGGIRQFITLARSTVLGVDVQTGKRLWSHEHESTCDQNVTSPIYHDGQVFVSSGHKAGARVVRLGADSRSAQPVWFGTRLDNCHGGVVLRDGHLYGSGCRLYNKGLLCVEFATGKIRYQAEEIGKVSLTWAEDRLYCFGNEGEMMLVQATPERATIVSRFPFPRTDREPTLTHPVVCGGRLYLRHLNDLCAYDIRAGQ